ncbi:unnamed protein product, partial [Iphiclides podalirius]
MRGRECGWFRWITTHGGQRTRIKECLNLRQDRQELFVREDLLTYHLEEVGITRKSSLDCVEAAQCNITRTLEGGLYIILEG